jgi:putative oxidoreductase
MKAFFGGFIGGRYAIALLLVRVVMGAAFVLHGWPKIQSPGSWMGPMGEKVPAFFQFLAAFAEFGGGLALIFGLLTPIAAAGIVVTMLTALFMVHLPSGHPFVSMGGPSYELSAIYLANALALIFTGPGAYSLDALVFGKMRSAAAEETPANRL